jgi:DNA polymerase-4
VDNAVEARGADRPPIYGSKFPHTPDSPPSSCEELTDIALKLQQRVDLGPQQLYRLAGVGLSNFREPEGTTAQPVLFE